MSPVILSLLILCVWPIMIGVLGYFIGRRGVPRLTWSRHDDQFVEPVVPVPPAAKPIVRIRRDNPTDN
jgi:hypothetical protein